MKCFLPTHLSCCMNDGINMPILLSFGLSCQCLHHIAEENDKRLAEAEDAFLNSPLLKELKERSSQNAEK